MSRKADLTNDQLTIYERVYQTAEAAYSIGLPLVLAIQAVSDGYSSAEFDQRYKAGEYE